MSRTSKRPTVRMPTVEEDRAITAAARSDPDAQPLTPKQLKTMVPLKALRGRPKSENKKLLVSVRYSPEVIAYFKSTGEGWQSLMDSVLRKYVARHSRSA
ncbi:BrnA antitoxin family protein [Azospira restricta]|uniref:BrnA antitoxin family protein n=2 Tax=Azospira restricta TaxID=404405 RepID=A0A974PVF4_9RHOO|nr:BrnA antitoxin family protein [Azospira restricta]